MNDLEAYPWSATPLGAGGTVYPRSGDPSLSRSGLKIESIIPYERSFELGGQRRSLTGQCNTRPPSAISILAISAVRSVTR